MTAHRRPQTVSVPAAEAEGAVETVALHHGTTRQKPVDIVTVALQTAMHGLRR